MQDFRLLIHHHVVAYRAPDSSLWLPAFVGRWINELAPYFRSIGLLMYETGTQTQRQDERIISPNVKLYSLGHPGYMWDRIQRMRRLRAVCHTVSSEADGLLIRGVTPRQLAVWRHTQVQRKAFLLVGSLEPPAPPFQPNFNWFYTAMMRVQRVREIRHMAADGIDLLANSPTLREQLERQCKKETRFVPTNSIRRDEFATFEVRKPTVPYRLLYCGRVVPDKGIAELIEALSLLEDLPCDLDIVGPCDSDLHLSYKELAKKLGVESRICWHGMIPYGTQLFGFYQRADVFVLPSFHEGFPHVIWEAQANCCSVVATAVGGIPSLLKHETHGLLIPPKNAKAIADAVRRLLKDDSLRSRVIEAAYNQALQYTVEACAEKLVHEVSEIWR